MGESNYNKYHIGIADICKKYGYTQCYLCPLVNACIIEKEDGESERDFTERWENAMANAYETEILMLV